MDNPPICDIFEKRLFITLGALAAVLLLSLAELPDSTDLLQYAASVASGEKLQTAFALNYGSCSEDSWMVLGLSPYIKFLSFLWVFALVIPPLRRSLLAGGKWGKVLALVLAAVYAAVASCFISVVLGWAKSAECMDLIEEYGLIQDREQGFSPLSWLLMGMIMTGCVVALALSRVVTRKGLGDGVLVLTLGPLTVYTLMCLGFHAVNEWAEEGVLGILPLIGLALTAYAAGRLFLAERRFPLAQGGAEGGETHYTMPLAPHGAWSMLLAWYMVSHSYEPLYIALSVAVPYILISRSMYSARKEAERMQQKGLVLKGVAPADLCRFLSGKAWLHSCLAGLGVALCLSLLPVLEFTAIKAMGFQETGSGYVFKVLFITLTGNIVLLAPWLAPMLAKLRANRRNPL